MKRILILLLSLTLYCISFSCSPTPDFSEMVVITEEPNEPDPNDPDPSDPNDPDPNDPDPQDPVVYPVECAGQIAGSYPCSGYDLMGWLPTATFGTSRGNDCWGWTDPSNGKEYGIYGLDDGTAFIDISNPSEPIYAAKLIGGSGGASLWRDIKVYNNFAYVVSEATGHGMQVFDLTELRDIDTANMPFFFEANATYDGFSTAHNIVINEYSGFAYAVGTNTYGGGAHFIDLQNPVNPVGVGGFADVGYSHDAQVITYNGPDLDYVGHELYIGSNGGSVEIVDVTDKNNPISVSSISYSDISFTHQGWITENHRFFIVGDETDELDFGINTRTIILDFTDLDNPQHYFYYSAISSSIDHNGYVKDDTYYLASHTAGLRIFDIANIAGSDMTEIGFFDVHPEDNSTVFTGAWSVYPYFDSGNIIISDYESGGGGYC